MLRCIEPGHYETRCQSLRRIGDPGNVNSPTASNVSLKVHVQIDRLNANPTTVFAKDVNSRPRRAAIKTATGFDISRDGGITLSEPRLAPVTDGYQQKATPRGELLLEECASAWPSASALLMGVVAAWLFRTTESPLPFRLAVPALSSAIAARRPMR